MKEEYQQSKKSDYSPAWGPCEVVFAVLCPLLAPPVQDKDWMLEIIRYRAVKMTKKWKHRRHKD